MIGPSNIFNIICKAAAVLVTLLVMATASRADPAGCADVSTIGQASPWKSLGIPSVSVRPGWVDACAERRLRLLPALPALARKIGGEADTLFRSEGPGVTIGLVLDDGLYFSQGYGFSDAAKKRTPDELTIYPAGSFSKVMTGTTLLTFTDEPDAPIALSDKADKFLPELDYVCPFFSKAQCACPNGQLLCTRNGANRDITVANLVSHTSGLANAMYQADETLLQWYSDIERSWLRFTPGAFSSYSGVAVEGVGLIESRLSQGAQYPAVVKSRLFDPLGMSHSAMDETTLPQSVQTSMAQRWTFSGTANGWSFSPSYGTLYSPNQVMLLPAGGLVISVWDLSRFITMWLTKSAPVVSGNPIISSDSLTNALKPQVAANAVPNAICAGNPSEDAYDTNFPPFPVAKNAPGGPQPGGFDYSPCGPNIKFGVNWAIDTAPFIEHNGETAVGGSEEIFDVQAHMGAVGLVSTDPFPAVPNVKTQPKNLDVSFLFTVVDVNLLPRAMAADVQTKTWASAQANTSTDELPYGVARLLWLSGRSPPKDAGELISLVQTPTTTLNGKPVVSPPPVKIPAGYTKVADWAVTKARIQYETQLEDQFDPGFIKQNIPNSVAIEYYLNSIFNGASDCSTFRVRNVHSHNDITLRFKCVGGSGGHENLDVRMATDSNGLIDGLVDASVSSGPF